MNTPSSGYSAHLLRGGRGVVAWQRLARFRRAVEAIHSFGPSRPLDLLVDIGAADGIGLPYWNAVARRVVSVNRYPGHSAEFRRAHPEAPIVTCEAQHLPFTSRNADAIVCLETLHFLPNRAARRAALRCIHDALAPDGVFVCSVAVEVGLPALVKYMGRGVTGFHLDGMGFGAMLQHVFYRMFDVSRYDRGAQVGFDAYRFARDVADVFTVLKRIPIPLPYPLCTNLMLVGRPRSAPAASGAQKAGE